MNLLNKIKLIFTSEQKKGETVKKVIQIEELPSKLESKINELTLLKKQLKEDILKRISIFEIEVNERVKSLENIDISQRKEYDKIKIIVKENLALYISYLKRTVDNLKDADDKEIEEYINRLFFILNEFNRVSSKPFEKAAILTGNELSITRATIKLFIQDINKIVEDNNFIFDKSRLCNTLSNLLSESKKLTLLHTEIEKKLAKMNATLENARIEHDLLKNKLLEIKEGDYFKEDNQEKIDYRNKLDSLEKEIQAIKKELDLKSLLKKFHHDIKIDQLVRNYINDFKNTLKEDKELRIIDIIENDDKKYISKIKEIQDTIIYLNPITTTKTDQEIALLEEKIKEESMHILNLDDNIKNEIKRKEKLSMKLQKISSDLMEKSRLLS